MLIPLPEFSLVLLVGASGSGKSSFAARHFAPTEILASDRFRAMICDDENNQAVSEDAFAVLHQLLEMRLRQRRLTVVDATNLLPESRKPIIQLAKTYGCPVFFMVLDPPLAFLQRRRRNRRDRTISAEQVRNQYVQLHKTVGQLGGKDRVFRFKDAKQLAEVRFERTDAWSLCRNDPGPFDLIGDVHGCYAELELLVEQLGYEIDRSGPAPVARHPQGRKLVFLGDLVDRGPEVVAVVELVMACVAAGTAYCAPGNHDMKLARKLMGHDVHVTNGLQQSLDQIERARPGFKADYLAFCERLLSHLILDEGRLIAVHAGIKPHYIGRDSNKIWSFALYGDVTGQRDEHGLPIRGNWAQFHDAAATIVYGHTPVTQAQWVNETLCIDTGCVYGGALTALRYPEREIVSVPAARVYYPHAAVGPAPAS